MSGKIIDIPGNPVTFAPETLPWATQGTTLPPNASQQETGWQPYGVGPPPDYRLENYARLTQSVLNARANQAGLFLEYTYAKILLVGAAVGNNRRITVDGTDIDYADQAGDTLAMVVDAFVTLINTDPAAKMVAVAQSTLNPGEIEILGLEPGNDFAVTVAVLAGAGTITLPVTPTPCITRQPGDLAYGADLVIGSTKLDNDGSPGHDARVIWDKNKAAFYAGKATGAQWNSANRGDGSVNFGIDNIASGANAVAIGAASTASGVASVAMGTSTASGQSSVAIGVGLATATGAVALGGSGFTVSAASATDAIAIGSGATASAVDAVALGVSAAATQTNAVALGLNAQATAINAVAVHGSASGAAAISIHGSSSGANAISLGEGAVANAAESIAIGKGVGGLSYLVASQTGALATGSAKADNKIEATGRGSRAHGAPDGFTVGTITASGVASEVMGELCVASGDYSMARGIGAVAVNRGENVRSSYCDITLANQDKGKHQSGQILLQARTTDATLTRLCTNAIDGTGLNWSPTNYRTLAGDIKIVCKDGAGKYATWFANLMIDKDAGTVTVHNTGPITTGATPPTYNTGAGMNGTSAQVLASGGEVVVRVAGLGATNLRWTAQITWVQAGENP